MPIEYTDDTAKFSDIVSIDDAEALFNWLLEGEKRRIDLSKVSHIHTACLQLLIVFKPDILKLPEQEEIRLFLTSLKGGETND